jgi:hypothetical protein
LLNIGAAHLREAGVMHNKQIPVIVEIKIPASGNKIFNLQVFVTFKPENYKQAFEAGAQHAGRRQNIVCV